MQFAAVGMPSSSQHREEERLRQARERREKERQQAQFLQRTFGLPQDEVPLEDFSCALQVRAASTTHPHPPTHPPAHRRVAPSTIAQYHVPALTSTAARLTHAAPPVMASPRLPLAPAST